MPYTLDPMYLFAYHICEGLRAMNMCEWMCVRVCMLTVCERQILFCWLNNIIIRCTKPLCMPLNQTVQNDDTRSRKIILIAYIAVETCLPAIIIHTLLFEFQVLCAVFFSFLSFSLLRTCSFPADIYIFPKSDSRPNRLFVHSEPK